MTKAIAYLTQRDGRNLFSLEVPDWALEDEAYKVTPLVSLLEVVELVEAPKESVEEEVHNLPNTDDTQERIQLMDELFQLQELEISQLKQSLEKFVEVAEGIIEVTDVISHSPIENRAKLLVISESCKDVLKPSE